MTFRMIFIFDLESDLGWPWLWPWPWLVIYFDCDIALPTPTPSQVSPSCNFEIFQSAVCSLWAAVCRLRNSVIGILSQPFNPDQCFRTLHITGYVKKGHVLFQYGRMDSWKMEITFAPCAPKWPLIKIKSSNFCRGSQALSHT